MPVTTQPLVITLLLSVLVMLTACEKGGDKGTVDAERQRLQQELQQARDETEAALRHNTLMQSRLKPLEVQVAAGAATVEPTVPLEADAEAEAAVDAGPGEVERVLVPRVPAYRERLRIEYWRGRRPRSRRSCNGESW
jgi:hypothetical protein